MRILVTGAGGQLGYDVCRELAVRGWDHRGADRQDFDITDAGTTCGYIQEYRPDAVIHCAAYTKVDQAEQEPEECWAVNGTGTENVAQACRESGAKLLYPSTDYIFDGGGSGFYETDTLPAPLNVYGRSKLAGEQRVRQLIERAFIVRTSWMFGSHGQNFVKAILRQAERQTTVRVVGDQFGSPTYTVDLARLLCDMAMTEQYGTYHAVNEGVCSWAEFARERFRCAGKDVRVAEISSRDYPSPVRRPANSRLSTESLARAGFDRLPMWQDAVERYLWEEGAVR